MKQDDVMYLDAEGHYGSAVGMILIDVSGMTAGQRKKLEAAKDTRDGVRKFVADNMADGKIKSHAYPINGTGAVISRRLMEGARPVLKGKGLVL